MATMKVCTVCRREVSPKAESCPQCGHPLRGPGLISRIARIGCLSIGALIMVGVMRVVLFGPREHRRPDPPAVAQAPAVRSAPVVNAAPPAVDVPKQAPPVVDVPKQAPPAVDALAPGTIVEVATVMVVVDRRDYDAIKGGAAPSQFHNRTEKFGVTPGTRARVLETQGDAVKVVMEAGNWKGREGWISRDNARVPPTPDVSEKDTKLGLSLIKRREIYGLIHRSGMLAVFEADRRVPEVDPPAEVEAYTERTKRHVACYEYFTKYWQRKLLGATRLSDAQLSLISQEGAEQRWPIPEVSRDELPPIDQVDYDPAAPSPTPKPAKRAKPKPKPKTLAPTSPAREASNLFSAAKKSETDGKIKDALAGYRKVIEGYPDTPEARMSRTRLKFLEGK